MIFGVRADGIEEYALETHQRLQLQNVVFSDSFVEKVGDGLYACKFVKNFPHFQFLFALGSVVTVVFGAYLVGIILFAVFGLFSFFFSRYFYMLMFLLGLRKKGIKTKVVFVSDQYLLEVLLGARRSL